LLVGITHQLAMKIFPLLAVLLVAVPGIARDWKKYPAVAQIAYADEIFAIGDAHSDFKRLARALAAAGIIETPVEHPQDARWHAGRAILVTTGDMIDKGPRALDVLRLLEKVREDARRAGGDVVILAGNHEAEFLADPAAPKGKEFAAQLKVAQVNPADVGACKGEFGEFLCSLAFAARVGDWFFAHGGNSGGRTVERLMSDLEAGVERDGFASKELIGEESILEARLNGEGRKPWIDARLPEQEEKQLLAEYAKALGVSHIVEGHVPSPVAFMDGVKRDRGEMFQRFGLLFLIDTGMSEGVDDSGGAVLHITTRGTTRGTARGGESAVGVCPDGAETLLWDSHSKQDVGRAKPCVR
jgi:Calcineurin-like phosphoesterase